MSMLPDDPESTILKRLKQAEAGRSGPARRRSDQQLGTDADGMPAASIAMQRWQCTHDPQTPEPTPTSIRTPTGCARNAACSASSAIPTPPPSPRSACTPCSIAARKPPASSPSTASASIPSAAWASSATPSPAREVIDRLPGNAAIGHVRYSTTGETILRNVQPLFAELDGGGFAIAPQRQPHQRPDAAPRAGRATAR